MKRTKPGAALLSVLLIVSTLFGSVVPVFAAGSVTGHEIWFPRSGDDAYGQNWGHGDLKFLNGWSSEAFDKTSVHTYGSYAGQACFCIEPGIARHDNTTYTEYDEEFIEKYAAKLNPSLTAEQMTSLLGRVMQYGYVGTVSTSWRSQNPDDADKLAHIMATQVLIWEVIVGERNSSFGHIDTGKYDRVSDYFSADHPLYSKYKSYYNSMEASVRKLCTLPSFTGASASSAESFAMKWDGNRFTVTLTDKNGVSDSYKYTCSDPNVKLSASDGKLTVSSAVPLSGSVRISAERSVPRRGFLVLGTGVFGPGSQSNSQSTVRPIETVAEKITAYVSVFSPLGKLLIKKTADDGQISGITFTIDGPSGKLSKKTGTDGTALFTDLIPGEYTVSESVPTRYVAVADKKITVKAEAQAELTFSNVSKKGSVTLTKTDSLTGKKISGAAFTVYSVSAGGSGTSVGKMKETSTGVFEMKDLRVGDYYVVETTAPSGYIRDTNQYSFSITKNGQVVEIVTKGKTSFINAPMLGSVTLTKTDALTGKKISGAAFTVYSVSSAGSGTSVGKMKETSTGVLEMKDLRVGDYYVVETTAPSGYIRDTKQYAFSITKNGQVVEIVTKGKTSLVNEPMLGSVTLTKTDALTGKKISGAAFTVYSVSSGSSGSGASASGTVVGKMKETSTGAFEMKDLRVGDYYVVETTAPSGYIHDTKQYPFSITKNGQAVEIVTKGKTSFVNAPMLGSVTLTKTDALTGKKISGAAFTVYSVSSGSSGSGASASGTVVGKMKETSTGAFEMKDLRVGDYYVVETAAPSGYIRDTKQYSFSITKNGQAVEIVTKGKDSFANIPMLGSVTLTKVDAEYPENKLSGAEFTVYAVSETEDFSIENAEAVGLIPETEPGVYTLGGLRVGKYLVKETKAPDGFLADENTYPFEITEDGQVVVIENAPGIGFADKPMLGSVALTKVDAEYPENKLSGAEFTVYAVSETEDFSIENAEAVGLISETEPGVYSLGGLRVGKYLVKETKAPDGFLADENIYPFEITEDGQVVVIENAPGVGFADQPMLGSVALTKVDAEYPENKLSGAEFTVYAVSETEDFSIENAEAVGLIPETEPGVYTLGGFRVGKYFVKETKAPDGFLADENIYQFEIIEDGQVVVIENEPGIGFADRPMLGSVTLTKVDAEYPENKLSGAEFTVYVVSGAEDLSDENTELIEENAEAVELIQEEAVVLIPETEPGVYSLGGLRVGKYLVKETKAPDGFLADENIYPFEITEDGQVVVIENAPGIGFVDQPMLGSVTLTKVDAGYPETKLSGAEFTVYAVFGAEDLSDENTELIEENAEAIGNNSEAVGLIPEEAVELIPEEAVGLIPETEPGVYKLGGLRVGKYLVRETKAPDGFLADENIYPFEITEDGQVIVIENEPGIGFADRPMLGSVTLTKVDAEYPENKLSGAEFTVYNATANDEELETVVGLMEESSQGAYILDHLVKGSYYIRETKAPDGFLADENIYPFEITEDGQVVVIENAPGIGFVDQPMLGSVTLTKVDAEYPENKLSGAEFTVYAVPGTEDISIENAEMTSENAEVVGLIPEEAVGSIPEEAVGLIPETEPGVYTLGGLRVGKYLVKETKAPDGFLADENIYPFEITEDGQIVVIENECGVGFADKPIPPETPPDIPPTGDLSLLIWGCIASFSLIAVLYVISRKKERT